MPQETIWATSLRKTAEGAQKMSVQRMPVVARSQTRPSSPQAQAHQSPARRLAVRQMTPQRKRGEARRRPARPSPSIASRRVRRAPKPSSTQPTVRFIWRSRV